MAVYGGLFINLATVPAVLSAAFLAASTDASAATVNDCKIIQEGQRYQIDFHATLNVSGTASYAIISDVANFSRINAALRRVAVLQHTDRDTRVELVAYLCVLWHCDSIHEVQDMTFVKYADGGSVTASVLPQYSDFRYGRSEWQVRESGGQTVLHIVAELEPAFDIPPVIGPWLVKRALRGEAERTAEGIERLAQR